MKYLIPFLAALLVPNIAFSANMETFKTKNVTIICESSAYTNDIKAELRKGGKILKVEDHRVFGTTITIKDVFKNTVVYRDLENCEVRRK